MSLQVNPLSRKRQQLLLEQFLAGKISIRNCNELFDFVSQTDAGVLEALVSTDKALLPGGPQFTAIRRQEIFARIKADPRYGSSLIGELPGGRKVRLLDRGKWLRLAAVLLVLGIPAIFLVKHRQRQQIINRQFVTTRSARPGLPGSNKATLTLSDGIKIELDAVQQGVLARQGNVSIVKTKKGSLVYNAFRAPGSSTAVYYNTISTPKGGQFQLVLPDGTLVWLNAASSLQFPSQFSQVGREVSLTGEAYFEVSKDRTRPFKVHVNHLQVEVLGTHFNINAYPDEPSILTTLASGSIILTTSGQMVLLKPDDQAEVFNNQPGHIFSRVVDVNNILAWKNGNFDFDNASIAVIMRQISRWYDVDIQYSGPVSTRRFTGSISRQVNLSVLLTMLRYSGINSKVEGQKVIVTS